jgi:hypothetical protein
VLLHKENRQPSAFRNQSTDLYSTRLSRRYQTADGISAHYSTAVFDRSLSRSLLRDFVVVQSNAPLTALEGAIVHSLTNFGLLEARTVCGCEWGLEIRPFERSRHQSVCTVPPYLMKSYTRVCWTGECKQFGSRALLDLVPCCTLPLCVCTAEGQISRSCQHCAPSHMILIC